MDFLALGRTYKVDVHKERLVTSIGGPAWRWFITQNNISTVVHLFFRMTPPTPRINVVYFDDGIDMGDDEWEDEEEDGEEEDIMEHDGEEDSMKHDGEEEDSMEHDGEDEHPFESTIFAQRCHLMDNEKDYVIDHLPQAHEFTGLPFVTRLTTTNIDLHNMVCFLSYVPLFLHFLLMFYCVGALSN